MSIPMQKRDETRLAHGVVSASQVSSGEYHLKSSLLGIVSSIKSVHRNNELAEVDPERFGRFKSVTTLPTLRSVGLANRLLLIGAVLSRIQQLNDCEEVQDQVTVELMQVYAELVSYFTLLRACLDDSAGLVAALSARSGQIPDTLFRLSNFCTKNPNRIDTDVAKVCTERMYWFLHLREIRNILVHGHEEQLVYWDNDRKSLQFDMLKHRGKLTNQSVHRLFTGDTHRLGIDVLDLVAHYFQVAYSFLERLGECLTSLVKRQWPEQIPFYYEACLQGRVVAHLVAALQRDLSNTTPPWRDFETLFDDATHTEFEVDDD